MVEKVLIISQKLAPKLAKKERNREVIMHTLRRVSLHKPSERPKGLQCSAILLRFLDSPLFRLLKIIKILRNNSYLVCWGFVGLLWGFVQLSGFVGAITVAHGREEPFVFIHFLVSSVIIFII